MTRTTFLDKILMTVLGFPQEKVEGRVKTRSCKRNLEQAADLLLGEAAKLEKGRRNVIMGRVIGKKERLSRGGQRIAHRSHPQGRGAAKRSL